MNEPTYERSQHDGPGNDGQDRRKEWTTPTLRAHDVDSVTEGGPFAPIGDDALYAS